MASTDAKPVPQKNVAYRVTFPIMDADGDLVTGATGLDSEVSKDGGTFADATSEATEIATSSGVYFLDLTSTEMNADTVAVIVKTTSVGAKTTTIVMYPEEAGDIRVNVTQVAGTTQTAGDIIGDTNDIQARLPAALVSGRIDASVGAMATGVLTATAIAADAITDAKVASDVTIASVTGAVGSVTGAVGSVTGNVGGNVTGSVGSVATGGITAASFAADAITAAKVAADVGTEIGTAVWATTTRILTANTNLNDLDAAGVRAAVGLAAANLDTQLDALPTAAENADAVWDEDATAHQTQGTFGQAIGDPVADSDTIWGLVNTNLNATVSSRASQASVDTIGTNVDAVLVDTGTALPAQITALNNLSAAQVNAEVVDALSTDTYAEPGQGAPAATASLKDKIGYLYKAWRNKVSQTDSTYSLYDDAGTTVDQKATTTDDGTTFSRTEIASGP
jgi:hypothetical protein